MSDGLRSLKEIIGSVLPELERRSHEVASLTSRVQALLAGEEKNHLLTAAIQGETLVILMDSAAWCAHVRYQQDQLRTALHAQGETQFTKVKVRVGQPGG